MIADDHAILRAGLKQILMATDDIEVIAEAQNAHEAMKLTTQLNPDVLLLDIAMPDRSGIEALKYIKKDNPHLSLIHI